MLCRIYPTTPRKTSCYLQVLPSDIDLLHPPAELEKQKHKLKRLVQSPNSFFMDVKCQGCFQMYVLGSKPVQSCSDLRCSLLITVLLLCSTTVFSHSQTVVVCSSCSAVLCTPTGGRARLTEGMTTSHLAVPSVDPDDPDSGKRPPQAARSGGRAIEEARRHLYNSWKSHLPVTARSTVSYA